MVWLLSLACVVVEGEEPLRAAVLAAIAQTGAQLEDGGDCTPVMVRVDRSEQERIAVEITDTSGRTTKREVRSPEMLAAVVEAWASVPSDLMEVPERIEPEPAGPVESVPPVEAATLLPAVAAEPVSEVETASPVRADDPSMFLLSARGEVAAGTDQSIVAGPAVAACVRFRWLCIDLTARLLFGGTVGEVATLGSRRSELEVALGATAELALGAVVLASGLSAGAAWLHFSPSGEDTPLACPPDDPCVVGEHPLRPAPFDRARPRVHATVALYVPVTRALALEVVGGGTFSPLANDFTLVEEARWSARFAAGLRIGL